jgi:hypothetical protein
MERGEEVHADVVVAAPWRELKVGGDGKFRWNCLKSFTPYSVAIFPTFCLKLSGKFRKMPKIAPKSLNPKPPTPP